MSELVRIQNKTANYTIVANDNGTVINCTTTSFTLSLTAAATLGAGFNCWIWNNATQDIYSITIDPNLSETIDGLATLVLRRGEGTQLVCNGTNWQTGSRSKLRGYSENLAADGTRPVATGNNSVAIHSYSTASGANSLAMGQSTSASGQGSTAIGTTSAVNGSVAIGNGSTAIGGAYASGTDSFAAAIATNSSSYGATGASGVAIGTNAKASGTRSTAIGYLASATQSGSVAIGGYAYGAQATGMYAVAIGDGCTAPSTSGTAIGWNNTLGSNAIGSIALGNENQTNNIAGKLTYGPTTTPGSGVPAARPKTGTQVLFGETTDATAKVLSVATNSGSSTVSNSTISGLENNTAFAFSAIIVARQQASGGTQSAAWRIEGLIRREGSAATTTLVNSATTVLSNAPNWTLTVSADTTNGGLAITATGAAATNIRWVATVQTSEVTYA